MKTNKKKQQGIKRNRVQYNAVSPSLKNFLKNSRSASQSSPAFGGSEGVNKADLLSRILYAQRWK